MKVKMIVILAFIATLSFSCDNGENVKSEASEEKMAMVEETKIASTEVETADDLQENVEMENDELMRNKSPQKTTSVIKNEAVESKIEQEREWPIEKQIEKETATKSNVVKVSESTGEVEDERDMDNSSEASADNENMDAGKPDHSAFNALLSKHVSSKGAVDYNGIKSDINKLDAYLMDLDKNTVASGWSRDEKLAYWINAYNAFTIKLILDNYPVNSIQDIASGKPWDKKWIKIGGKTYSLNQIENDIIRPEFNEPRIHFAVNCAAQSCPPIANKAFTADNLNSLLEKQTKSFINNSKYNNISSNKAQVSKIFDWYGEDFGDKLAFLNKYSSTEIAGGTKITYTDYDWGLNNK